MDTLFEEYEPVKDIMRIGQYAFVKYQKPIKEKKRGITNERQSVLKEIQTEMEKDGKVNVKLLAIRLSHIPTEDLYFMLSEAKDYRKRGKGEFSKYIWGSIKPRFDKN